MHSLGTVEKGLRDQYDILHNGEFALSSLSIVIPRFLRYLFLVGKGAIREHSPRMCCNTRKWWWRKSKFSLAELVNRLYFTVTFMRTLILSIWTCLFYGRTFSKTHVRFMAIEFDPSLISCFMVYYWPLGDCLGSTSILSKNSQILSDLNFMSTRDGYIFTGITLRWDPELEKICHLTLPKSSSSQNSPVQGG